MSYAAFLLDGRPYHDLEPTIRDHIKYLPEDWDCLLFLPASYASLMKRFRDEPRVKFFEVPPDMLNSYEKYDEVLARDLELWEILCGYDRVLLFQEDSKILRPGVEEFLEWDYIGAPWPTMPQTPMIGYVGNGGLSLRNPKVFLDIAKNEKHDPPRYSWRWYEDQWFISYFKKYDVKVAPVAVAERFSVENIFKLGSFGCHAIEKCLSPEQCKQILTQYGVCGVSH